VVFRGLEIADKARSGAIDAVSGSDLTIDSKASRWATGSSPTSSVYATAVFS
jgi:hypothetical protein